MKKEMMIAIAMFGFVMVAGCTHDFIDLGACTADSDCADGDPCTVDICGIDRTCVQVPSDNPACDTDADASDGGGRDADADADADPDVDVGGCVPADCAFECWSDDRTLTGLCAGDMCVCYEAPSDGGDVPTGCNPTECERTCYDLLRLDGFCDGDRCRCGTPPGADADADADVGVETDTDADVGTEVEVGADADADVGVETEVSDDAGADADVGVETDTDADADADTEVEVGADADADADADTDVEADADAGCVPAEEICDDGIDNDCDGRTDLPDDTCVFCLTDDMITCYYDSDHDGYGVSVPPIRACPDDCVGDWTPSSGDCRYWDPASYPGAEEICDGHDNDCDTGVDEDCPCSDGEVVVCHCGEVLGESHCGTDHRYDGSCECSVCGDGICFTTGVFQENCPADCGFPSCGDGVCNGGETLLTCSRDCGYCRFEWNLAGSADPPAACGSWWYIWDRVRCGDWIGLSAEMPTTACLDALRARLALPPGAEGRIYGVDSAGNVLHVSIVDPASTGGPTWPNQLGWAFSF